MVGVAAWFPPQAASAKATIIMIIIDFIFCIFILS
jgi:hypothetical protein